MISLKPEFLKKRWFEFRTAYSTYLVFGFGFSNFLLIVYRLNPEIEQNIPIIPFMILATVGIMVASVVLGNRHFKSQFPTDAKIQAEYNPYNFKVMPKSKEEIIYLAQIHQLNAIRDLIYYNSSMDREVKWAHMENLALDISKFLELLKGKQSDEILNEN